jgi:hypothetical protein
MKIRIALLLFLAAVSLRASAPDKLFLQDRSEQYRAEGELAGAVLKRVHVNKDGIVYVLTDRGMARLFGNKLALDRSFRPFTGKNLIDSAMARGEIFYLFEDQLLCNGFAGKYFVKLPAHRFDHVQVTDDLKAWLSGPKGSAVVENGALREIPESEIPKATPAQLAGKRVPFSDPTLHKQNWFAGKRGLFRLRENGACDYYGSRRWLLEDAVIDLDLDAAGNVYALTKSGLNKIAFEPMTLDEKATHYDRKIRERHIRFGFCSELSLSTPGDPSTAQMIDTDNDGTWSNYYMASQAFRFGSTGDPAARSNAWETFAALERLESINKLGGFPARTYERLGFKYSDVDRWRDANDGFWEWKGHTSSDEIIAHAFGSSALYECAATTPEEKQRIAAFIGKIVDHLLRNNLYLIDVDGKPTLWGRWNPEYVNWFPPSIFDRRLNSAEMVALLQFAYAITGRAEYKAKAFELMEKHGYLENILSPLKNIAYTKGYVHEGIELGNDWNHSDDLLAFDTYWVLHRYAFDSKLKRKYAAAIREHVEFEKREKNPLFNFVYASTGAKDVDVDGALWILRRFPLDMVDWTMLNSHRLDVTKLGEDFRQESLVELLPPGERRITRWNGHPFVLDGGSGGRIELAGDEFLLPYWMGRYLKVIAPPKASAPGPAALP